MERLNRILVPVDLGANTDCVVEAPGKLAKTFGANVRLLYVIEDVPQFPEALELLSRAARERLSELQKGLIAAGVRCEAPMSLVGKPFDTIVRTANQVNAHLIILGRGGSLSGASLGTTTARVLRRTAHPVIAIAPGSTGEIRRILCPVDGSNASARGLHNAILLATQLNARLTVMTVITEFPLQPWVARRTPDVVHIASEYAKMEREQFEQFIKGFDFGKVTWDKEVHYGHPAEQIVNLANDAKYDLIIMGSTGRAGLPRVLLGSTAESVARRVACSVLTLKREDVLSARLESDLADLNRLLVEGQELLDEGQFEEAIGKFDQCLLKDPYLAPAVEGLANAHERLGHHDRAAELHGHAELIRRELWQQQEPSVPVAK